MFGCVFVRAGQHQNEKRNAIGAGLCHHCHSLHPILTLTHPQLPLPPPPQASFNLFGMELLAGLDVTNTADFFTTFFRLPPYLWQSFLASKLSSTELLGFALATFALAPLNIQVRGKGKSRGRSRGWGWGE